MGKKLTINGYFETLDNRTGGANDEYKGGPGGLGIGFCSPGGGFSDSRRGGKPLRLLKLKNHPRDYKNQYQDHQFTPILVIRAPVRLSKVLE